MRLDPDQRYRLTLILRRSKPENLSYEAIAERAEIALRTAAVREARDDEERKIWQETEVSADHVRSFFNFHSRPTSTPASRARFLGVLLALGVDRDEVARVVSGI